MRAWRGLSEPIRQQEPAYVTAMAPYRAPGFYPSQTGTSRRPCRRPSSPSTGSLYFFLRWDSSHPRDAESVRTELVRDGLPADRVELTPSREKGRAGLQRGAHTPTRVKSISACR